MNAVACVLVWMVEQRRWLLLASLTVVGLALTVEAMSVRTLSEEL